MNLSFYNLVQLLSLQLRKNIKVVKLIVGIEFIQNIALSFPKHGWGFFKYRDKMLKAISQITNYSLFLAQSKNKYSFDVFIILLSFTSFIFILFCLIFHQKDVVRHLINQALNILNKILKLPLMVIYVKFLYKYNDDIGCIIIGSLTLLTFLIVIGLITYFQRDISYNLSRSNVPIYEFYSPVLYFIHIIDMLRIILFTIFTTSNGQILFQILTIIRTLLKQYNNIFQQNDEDKFNQSLIFCNLFISISLLIAQSTNFDEKSIFNLLLYSSTLLYYLFTQINLNQIIKSNSIQYLIQQKLSKKKVLPYYFNNNMDVFHLKDLINSSLLEEIQIFNYSLNNSSLQYYSIFQKEENILILFDFLVKYQKRFYLAFYFLYKFESIQTNLSYFYKQISAILKSQVQKELLQISHFSIEIKNLNKNGEIDLEYKKQAQQIFAKQIEFLQCLASGAKSFQEIEKFVMKISESIQRTKKWLKKNQVLDNNQNLFFLRISFNFNTQIMQNQIQGIKLNKALSQIMNSDTKTIDFSQTLQSDFILLPVSLIKKRGSIINSKSQINQFLGFQSKDIKLENIEQLMPEAIQLIHNQFLERYINRSQYQSDNKHNSIKVLQKQENEFVQCLQVTFTISNDFSDFILLSLIKKANQDKVFIIFDTSGKITGISQNLKEYWPEIFDQMQFHYFIQYYCPQLFDMISNQDKQQEIDLNFIYRSNIQKIDRLFRNFIMQETLYKKSSQINSLENINSDRSEKQQLLFSKYQNIFQDIYNFNILEILFQNQLNQIVNLCSVENDIIQNAKGQLNKVEFSDKIIQYQLELKFNEMPKKNENFQPLNSSKNKLFYQQTKSQKECSNVGTEFKATSFLHNVLLKQTGSTPFKKIYMYKFIVILMIISFLILQIYQSKKDGSTKLQITNYIYAPYLMVKHYNDAFQLGFNKLILQDMESSQYFKNSLKNQLEYKLYQIREEYEVLYSDLINIDATTNLNKYNINILQNRIPITSIATFSEKIRENMITLVFYEGKDIQFIKSVLFFRINIIQAYNITMNAIETFSVELANYQSNIMDFWNSILIIQVILLIIPFLINIRNWYNFEKRHQYMIQILSKLNEEQAYQLIDQKRHLIQQINQEIFTNHCRNSIYSAKNLNYKFSTSSIQLNNRQRSTQILYEKIQNKSNTILMKLSVTVFCYLLLVFLASFGYLQTKQSDHSYQPIEQLIKTYVKFQVQLSYLISFTSIMKGQQQFLNTIQNIKDAEIGDVNKLFSDDDVPIYFKNLSQTFSKKVIVLFSTIILTNQIEEKDKSILYDLYQDDFCNYLEEQVKFCKKNITQSQFENEYGQFYSYENNSDALKSGVIGFISKLDSLLKYNFDIEISRTIYDLNQSTNFYNFKDYNNLVVQYSLNISQGFNLFYEQVNYISSKLIINTKNNLIAYYLSFNLSFLFLYMILSCFQIKYFQRRYKSYLLGLVTLSEDLLNDKKNIHLLKKLID